MKPKLIYRVSCCQPNRPGEPIWAYLEYLPFKNYSPFAYSDRRLVFYCIIGTVR
jgi:hypothetical protein